MLVCDLTTDVGKRGSNEQGRDWRGFGNFFEAPNSVDLNSIQLVYQIGTTPTIYILSYCNHDLTANVKSVKALLSLLCDEHQYYSSYASEDQASVLCIQF